MSERTYSMTPAAIRQREQRANPKTRPAVLAWSRSSGAKRRANPEKHARILAQHQEWVARHRNDPEKQADIRAQDQARARVRALRRNYSLTLAGYVGLFVAQIGLCGICHKPMFLPRGKIPGNAQIDHAHEFGPTREAVGGLVDAACNVKLREVERGKREPTTEERDWIEEHLLRILDQMNPLVTLRPAAHWRQCGAPRR